MRFIKVWSYSLSKWLQISLKEKHQQRGIYYYGFQLIIGALVKGFILISLSLILGIVVPALIIMGVFAALRVIAGGFHMDTYGKCIATSTGLFITAGLISQYTWTYWTFQAVLALIVFTLITGLYVCIRYAPKDTPNKPITDINEIRKAKRLSVIYVITVAVLTSIGLFFGFSRFIIPVSFGLLLELFTITPTGHKFFYWVSGEK